MLIPGHEIVATIAQIHLHPNVKKKLCGILPPQAKCHLAPIAAWADQVKGHYPGSAPMHYINREFPVGTAVEGHVGAGGAVHHGQRHGTARGRRFRASDISTPAMKLPTDKQPTWTTRLIIASSANTAG